MKGLAMNTSAEAERLLADPPVLATAANEEFAASTRQSPGTRQSTGWDPYEVWRTRIKAVQEALSMDIAAIG
jgi:hypothetical protein